MILLKLSLLNAVGYQLLSLLTKLVLNLWLMLLLRLEICIIILPVLFSISFIFPSKYRRNCVFLRELHTQLTKKEIFVELIRVAQV